MRNIVLAGALVLGCAAPTLADVHLVPTENAPLNGKTIVFSPGHGFFRDGGRWRFQRGVKHGIREDIHTNEIFTEFVQRYLTNAGARVESVRERSFQHHEVIVDDGQAGYTETGTWGSSTSAPDFYGTRYRYAAVSSRETATAEFQPNLPEAGRYPVYVWFARSGNRSTDARFTVHHSGGRTTVTIDQQDLGDSWIFLGEFHFEVGTAGKVVLSNQGSDSSKFVIADAVRFGGGMGASGKVRWREAAKEFLAYKGFSSSRGDVTIRPAYATWLAGGDTSRWRSDYLYMALHTNASGSSTSLARGLSSFSYSNGRTPAWGSAGARHYPTSPSSLEDQSDALRDSLHREVLATIRADIEPSWRDRRVHRMNFGELREARNMPSALIELGFHDNVEDAALLADARFRAAAARGIYKGIIKYWAPGSPIIPLPPNQVAVENLGGGQVRVSWREVLDPLESSAAPTSYKLYLSSNGRGFDDGRIVSGTSQVLTGLQPGQAVFVRIAAVNGGGESLPTRVFGAVTGDPVFDRVLLVDGFHRSYTHTHENVDARYTYDYGVLHLDALMRAAPGVAIDSASNEAVLSGRVDLANYALVDWLLARESSRDRTFDPSEQNLVQAYLVAGGALFVSGTEIGWDLKARGGGERFLEDVLGARYVKDDAGTRAARIDPGSPFTGLGALILHDGTQGSYDAAFPDVLEPSSGHTRALAWETAGAPGAGVAQSAPYRVVVLGFPLEAVVDDTQRRALAAEAVRFLTPTLGTGQTPPNPGQIPPNPGTTNPPPPPGGTTTAPVTTPSGSTTAPIVTTGTTAPGSTQSTAPPARRSSGGGCTLDGTASAAPASPLILLALLLLLLGHRRAETEQAA